MEEAAGSSSQIPSTRGTCALAGAVIRVSEHVNEAINVFTVLLLGVPTLACQSGRWLMVAANTVTRRRFATRGECPSISVSIFKRDSWEQLRLPQQRYVLLSC